MTAWWAYVSLLNGSQSLSCSGSRDKIKDTKYLLKENWQNLGANDKVDDRILSLESWDNGSTTYRYQKATVGWEMMGLSKPPLDFFENQVFSEA